MHSANLDPKVLPNAVHLEGDLIGFVFQEPAILGQLSGHVSAEDFFAEGNRQTWRTFTEMRAAGHSIDPKLAFTWMAKKGRSEAFGGDERLVAYFIERMNTAVGKDEAEDYAKAIRATRIARDLIDFGQKISKAAYAVTHEVDTALEEAHRRIGEIGTSASSAVCRSQWDASAAYFAGLDERIKAKKEGRNHGAFLRTGWHEVDSIIGGLFASELTIVAARPSVGKTVFGGCLARNLGKRGIPGFFASLEQRDEAIIGRMLASLTDVPGGALREGDLKDYQNERVANVTSELMGYPIWWDHRPTQTIQQISATARSLKLKHGIQYVIIDYLTLVKGQKGRDRTRNEEVGEVSRLMKALARELQIPVVSLAQLNRGSEQRTDTTPKLSDLRDSGEIEQNADVVLLLHKPDPPDANRKIDRIEIHVAKCREGSLGKAGLEHHKSLFDFRPAGEVPEYGRDAD